MYFDVFLCVIFGVCISFSCCSYLMFVLFLNFGMISCIG